MTIYYVRKIYGNKYGYNGLGQLGWKSTEQATAEIPNPDFLPSNIGELTLGHYISVNTGKAGEFGAYILAESQDEAIRWVNNHLP